MNVPLCVGVPVIEIVFADQETETPVGNAVAVPTPVAPVVTCVTVVSAELSALIEDLVVKLGVKGPIDIDVFKVDDVYYILEVNPRFGGGYVHAYECGINFPKYIKNNLLGISNDKEPVSYLPDVYLMKTDRLVIKSENELLK